MRNAIETTFRLQGDRVKDFLQKKGFHAIESDEDGNVILGDHLFTRPPEHWFVATTSNREIVIYSENLRSKGRKSFRKVAVNREGIGTQQITQGVELVVQTNASIEVFQQNMR